MSATHTRRAPSVAAVMLGVIVAVRIWNAVVYNLRPQHDEQVHIGYLRDLVGGASAACLGAAALRFYNPADGDIAKWEYVVWVFVFLPIPIVQALSSLDGQPARLARAALLSCAAAGCLQSVVTKAF